MPAIHLLRTNSPQAEGGLALSLDYARDRFVSTIQLVRDERVLLRLESVEGDATDPWPPSPPVQQLHQQQGPHGEFVAGIGMSGTSHWSLSVTARTGQPDLEFDVACRAKAEAGSFASTYRLSSSAGQVVRSDAGLVIDCGSCTLSLTGDNTGEGRSRVEWLDDLLIRFHPEQVSSSYPQTVRWKYRIGLIGPVDKVASF